MPLRIRFPKSSSRGRSVSKRAVSRRALKVDSARLSKIAFFTALGLIAIAVGFVAYSYVKYANIADAKLEKGPFPNSSILFAAPRTVGVGDEATVADVAAKLNESGYQQDAKTNPWGWYHIRQDGIEIFPGKQSETESEPAVLKMKDGKIVSIIALSDNSSRPEYALEPAVLSTMFDENRNKRRLVKFQDIPPVLVHAVISIEDKRFFSHSGFDPIRLVKAAFVDLRQGGRVQGASTLTQQLAKKVWLDPRKTFSRKFQELLITIHLERKLTKEQIFEYYANQVDLGRRGSFGISGFGEAAQAFFGKDIKQLTLPEAALLAGLVQSPSSKNPFRWPDRALARRHLVLESMLDNGYISQAEYKQADATPLMLTKQGIESTDAPYFVDHVNEQLADQFSDHDFQESGSRIYTTLDLDLQHDAAVAVADGVKSLDEIMSKRSDGQPFEAPQVALICLDPHTGEVKALIGGRNYGLSQLDHTNAKRPSGSAFKPFVYATALNGALWNSPNAMTTSLIVDDSPKTFMWNGEEYNPHDMHKVWAGPVTLRTAFARSLNVPAIEVAEQAGYRNVSDLAHKAGLVNVRATPSMALGTYNVTPMDMAGAYTIFANDGVMVTPRLISHIVDKTGKDIWSSEAETKRVLDPRVNFLVVSLMEDVLRWGTGAGASRYGFNLPAAAKTGTSQDAWFAGFTSKLLCIVWVGLDDYKDIKMEGAHAAMPIWAEFMARAHKHRAYRTVSWFPVPSGIVTAQIDNQTGQLATSGCPPTALRTEYYLDGTAPTQFCPLHAGGTQVTDWQMPLPTTPPTGGLPPSAQVQLPPGSAELPESVQADASAQKEKPPAAKKGPFEKLKSVFHH